MTTERWVLINEYKDFNFAGKYEISNWGNVRETATKKIFATYSSQRGQGYLKTKIRDINNVRRAIYIHQVVAWYFLNGYQKGFEVDHIDGNVKNNSFTNLRYLTHAENLRAYADARKLQKVNQ